MQDKLWITEFLKFAVQIHCRIEPSDPAIKKMLIILLCNIGEIRNLHGMSYYNQAISQFWFLPIFSRFLDTLNNLQSLL